MTFETAKAAVDYYLSMIIEGKRYNPLRSPAIGFYGGEPLLNFDLIKKIVRYIDDTYPDIGIYYAITTNGTLLNGDTCDFLMDHGFSIAVSIDGPQKEHDRNRVYKNGNGTFNVVRKNVKRMIDKNYPKCHSIAVFDWKSDLFAIQKFFKDQSVPKLSFITMPSANDNGHYYERFTEHDFLNFQKLEETAFTWYRKTLTEEQNHESFFDLLFGLTASKTIYATPMVSASDSLLIPYTGTCIPGRKLFVDVDGVFHICERINQTFPIGNIYTGLDYSRIAELINDYCNHLDVCPDCPVKKSCPNCYCAFALTGNFKNASDMCGAAELLEKNSLSRAFSIGEKNQDVLEALVGDHYSWLSGISQTLGD